MQEWEPLSSNKRQAGSAVEVFRIVEEVCVNYTQTQYLI